ncbi:hypothetical protein EV182_006527 [Spiromyces aspiralis]|uniref:Uncharacterized protein n=1 Tax=Spiromyces aspiralis TaxID=68401 RepID=A0ACC1HFR2_9FUNG|nr:hypothetical protein EV182_006527 [Spiromyces aspiralis]
MGPKPTPRPATLAQYTPTHTPARLPNGKPAPSDDTQTDPESSEDDLGSIEESDADSVELTPEDFAKEQHLVEYYPRAPTVLIKHMARPTRPHPLPPPASRGNMPSDGTSTTAPAPVRRLRSRLVSQQ